MLPRDTLDLYWFEADDAEDPLDFVATLPELRRRVRREPPEEPLGLRSLLERPDALPARSRRAMERAARRHARAVPLHRAA
jgi:hypothetical protein